MFLSRALLPDHIEQLSRFAVTFRLLVRSEVPCGIVLKSGPILEAGKEEHFSFVKCTEFDRSDPGQSSMSFMDEGDGDEEGEPAGVN